MITWNSIPHQATDASSRIRFKKHVKNTTLWNNGDCEETHTKGTDTCIRTHCDIEGFVLWRCGGVGMLHDVLF